ncbi:uncharacterized protein PGTG_20228 [Puccinia graminis f. sp. tritici CRL 75-36-700-3]|uniref:Uncharacterized protein n=2 Tax=Puccinia graminis f. sp. tritici TaxID=56615 RepID=E3NXI1_PUCGT|nr:uncharacterized protein PGTG_20228 [Puccinia graminis f. sp. tritici CRL 75-36-700-3]EFP94280.2 hypothetical protein PGTG_20228 [Puccinia graminis f. sp. tritici CRL 75-36-700-3]
MSDKDKVANRPLSFRSNFRPLEESVPTIKPGQIYGSVSTPSFVTCNANDAVDYRVSLITTGTAAHVLSPDSVYGLSGRVLLLNGPAPPIFNYYIELVTKICSAANQIEDSTDRTFTSGVGLVVGLLNSNVDADLEVQSGKKQDLHVQVNHRDWDPTNFNVKYIIPANPKLVNTHIMIRVGREFVFDGYLSGWDLKDHSAIITVLGFSPINMGFSSPGPKTNPSSPRTSPATKGRKFITFEESDSKVSQPSVQSANSNVDGNDFRTPVASTSGYSSRPGLLEAELASDPAQAVGLIEKGKTKAVDSPPVVKKRRRAAGIIS